ncbi:G-type lectin S-receptor-like serine/threonine-protein kinase, partial [Thalictrum thalictroides]
MYADPINGFAVIRDEEEGSVYLTVSFGKKPLNVTNARYLLNSLGQLTENVFVEGENRWVQDWSIPQRECDFYGKCGIFGFCNMLSKPVCSCLEGYEPASIDEWSKGNWSSGCAKRKPFRCERNSSRSKERKEDGFILHERMKVPDHMVNWVRGGDFFGRELDDCKQTCLRNCSCRAYSHGSGGCMWWHGNLIDMQKFSIDGVDLYIRVAHSEL